MSYEIKGKLNDLINLNKNDVIESLQELLRIKSTESEPLEGMPFGKGVSDSLEYTLNLCRKLGLETEKLGDCLGYCEYGKGKELMGILVHLDVVPEGNDWDYPPYGAEIHDGKIYARGSIDDKGPAIASIYALYIIKELNIDLDKRVRIIFGTNEETDWKCMKYYRERAELPDFGFTPDGGFPVINGEKGIVSYKLIREFNDDKKISINSLIGGERENMVPDKVEIDLCFYDDFIDYILEIQEKANLIGFETIRNGNNLKVVAKGISTHASTPQFGVNAISRLMTFLGEIITRDCELKRVLQEYVDYIGMEYDGKSLGVDFFDRESGNLTLNIGTAMFNENRIEYGINIRYPVTVDKDLIKDTIKAKYSNIDIVETDFKKPIYISAENDFIKDLLKVYRDSTGDMKSEPMVIGGGTYARAFDNIVAFGPVMPDQESLAHEKNEYIGVNHLLKLIEIYSMAIMKLAGRKNI